MLAFTGAGVESVLKGIASLLWPVVALTAVLLFKTELRDLIRRIRKGKVLGQEIELDKSLDKLEKEAHALADAPLPTLSAVEPTPQDQAPTVEGVDAEIQQVLNVAAESPKAALMQLAAALEREGRRLLAATGHLEEISRSGSLRQIAEVLERATTMPRGSLDVFRNFSEIRNAIVHGGQATDDEILRAVDSGIVLLRSLAAVPVERNIVYHPGVPIYSDSAAAQELPGRGVILETTSPGGAVVSHRIFPTTRNHFRKGMRVAWEWSAEHRWGDAWYRDPDTGEVKSAWGGSMEFVGRNLDEV